jgi:hypothetical protein
VAVLNLVAAFVAEALANPSQPGDAPSARHRLVMGGERRRARLPGRGLDMGGEEGEELGEGLNECPLRVCWHSHALTSRLPCQDTTGCCV